MYRLKKPVQQAGMHFLVLLIITLAGCKKLPLPESLIFADIHQIIMAPVYVAEVNGYFREENLAVIYKTCTTGNDSIQAVIDGTADIGAATEFPLVKHILAGEDLQIIGTVHRTNKNIGLVIRKDAEIREISDLTGKKIGVTLNTNGEYALSLLLNESGFTSDQVILDSMPPQDAAERLISGRDTAVITWEPHVTAAALALPPGEGRILRAESYTEISVLGIKTGTGERKREALTRFMRALVKAEKFINSENKLALDAAIGYLSPGESEFHLRSTWPILKFQVRLDNLLLSSLENEAEWVLSLGESVRGLPDFRRCLDTRFLDKARPQAVTLPADTSE